jgi:hypothetical protein
MAAGEGVLEEPGRRWERVATQPAAIYSSSPAVLRSGIVYESIGRAHYTLRWAHDDANDEFIFTGEAFHPVAESPDGPIKFELVAHGATTTMLLDVLHNHVIRASRIQTAEEQLPAATSPDGRWTASTEMRHGSEQIWLRNTKGGSAVLLAGGNCNSFAPTWELDSKALVFASDCDRGIGLPALYRARVDNVGDR